MLMRWGQILGGVLGLVLVVLDVGAGFVWVECWVGAHLTQYCLDRTVFAHHVLTMVDLLQQYSSAFLCAAGSSRLVLSCCDTLLLLGNPCRRFHSAEESLAVAASIGWWGGQSNIGGCHLAAGQ